MLIELAHYLATPVPWAHRRLGYLRESVLLLSRSRRCRAAWAAHLAACRAVVEEACADLPRRRVAVVLGSGLIEDVPLPVLAGRFAQVRLVDAVHLWPVRLRARAFANVRLVTADLNGDDALAAHCGGEDVDFVVSANVLSQLPILPLDRHEARGGAAPEELGRAIVARHLDGLARLRARVCLLTDIAQSEEDREGRVTGQLDLLHGLTLPPPDRSWTWELAPFGETARHRRLRHQVVAYRDWSGLARS